MLLSGDNFLILLNRSGKAWFKVWTNRVGSNVGAWLGSSNELVVTSVDCTVVSCAVLTPEEDIPRLGFTDGVLVDTTFQSNRVVWQLLAFRISVNIVNQTRAVHPTQ